MPQNKGRILQGVVISDAPEKTVVVRITLQKVHPKYKKRYQIFKKYHAHDEKNEFHSGDVVEIQETRPMSKHKHWKVVRKVN